MYNKDEFWHFEQKAWESVADKYENSFSSLTRQFIPELLKLGDVKQGSYLLDLACGPGYVSEAAKNIGAIPTGIDFSEKMIALAKEKNPSLKFFAGDAEELNFGPCSFDAVTMNFGILHVSQPNKVFSEAARVLNKGGKFSFTVWSKVEENPGSKILHEAIAKFATLHTNIPEGPPSDYFTDPCECFGAFKAAGFNLMNFLTVNVEWKVPTADFYFEAELNGGVRTAAILKAQSKEVLDKIRISVVKQIEKLKNGNGYIIPMSAHVISAAVNSG